jgi:hypothetical protein
MKKIATLVVIALASMASAWGATPAPALKLAVVEGQSGGGSVTASLTWTAPGCAATITTNSSGQEASGPCLGQVYALPVAAGTTSCTAFSTSAYKLLSGTVAVNSATGTYSDTSETAGTTVCYAVTDTFTAGGAPGSVSNTFPILILVSGGTPGTPVLSVAAN